jgi:hypothetical protein
VVMSRARVMEKTRNTWAICKRMRHSECKLIIQRQLRTLIETCRMVHDGIRGAAVHLYALVNNFSMKIHLFCVLQNVDVVKLEINLSYCVCLCFASVPLLLLLKSFA